MSTNGSGSKAVKVNFSDEDTLFTLWFHLINFCFSRAYIYKMTKTQSRKKNWRIYAQRE